MSAGRKIDLVTLEVIRNALPAISNEMSYVLQRASYNMMIFEVRDYCCTLLDVAGKILSQNTGGVSHFVADAGILIQDGINKYGKEGFKPGDVIVTNHQRVAGQHLNNMVIYTPFFFNGELVGFPLVRAHWVDIGGASTGVGSADVIDPWMEGFQIDQIKLYDEGKLDAKVWQLLRDNIRLPESSLGDLRAQLAACKMAERRLDELLKRYGKDEIMEAVDEIAAQTEARCRAVIEKIPAGVYEAESMFGSFSFDPDGPFKIKAKVIVEGSTMTVDLTGCAGQRRAAINSRTLSPAKIAYKLITAPFEPVNDGSFRGLNVIINEGNFMMAKYPAPMSDWSVALPTVIDVILKALAPAMPDKIPAGNSGVMGGGGGHFHGTDPKTGKMFVASGGGGSGWGARPWEDGESACCNIVQGDVRNAPIEKMELKWPVMVSTRGLRQDSGGPGKFRGGMGSILTVKNLIPGRQNFRSDAGRNNFPPWGLWGGKAAVTWETHVTIPGKPEMKNIDMVRTWVPAETEVTSLSAGGGGWGDPLDRDPEKVRWDVLEEYVSLKAAHDEYGVVLNPDTLEIDQEGTSRLRKEMRRRRADES